MTVVPLSVELVIGYPIGKHVTIVPLSVELVISYPIANLCQLLLDNNYLYPTMVM